MEYVINPRRELIFLLHSFLIFQLLLLFHFQDNTNTHKKIAVASERHSCI